MLGLEEFLVSLLEHLRTGRVSVGLIGVLVMLLAPAIWHLFWRSVVLRRIEKCYLQRIQDLEGAAARSLALAEGRISMLEEGIRERDELLRERDQAVIELFKGFKEAVASEQSGGVSSSDASRLQSNQLGSCS